MIMENKVWLGLFYDGAYKKGLSKSLLGLNIVIMIILYAAQCNKKDLFLHLTILIDIFTLISLSSE